MIVKLDIPNDKWEFLKPILKQFLPIDQTREINIHELIQIPCGVRIANIFKDGAWPDTFSPDLWGRGYAVRTIYDLLRVEKSEFLKHRHAGMKSWSSLEEYIEKIRKEQDEDL